LIHLRKRSRIGLKKSLGFTLVETLVAMVIMSGGVMVLANSWSGNFMRIRNSRINNTMAILLERKMTEVDVKYKDRPFDEVAEADAGDFGTKYPGYRWEMKAKKFEMPDMSSALISKEGGSDEMTLMIVRTVQDFIKEAVKEISVTVYYKGRVGKEVRNTVTVYLVDYTKELPMPAGMPPMDQGKK
jgi:general secretion pathway protein I